MNPLPLGEGRVRGGRLLGERSAEALRWHFQFAAAKRQTKVLCCRREGRLVGYAVVERRDAPEIGLKRARIADLLAEGDDPDIVDALLRAAHRHAHATGSHVLELIGFPQSVRARFLARHPYRRKLEAWPYYYKAPDRKLAAELEQVDAWYACPYDGDASL